MRYTSSDGLMSSADPQAVALWESICNDQASEQVKATALLKARGVKLEHPDDGWVNRERNSITPSYPRFDERPAVGDLIALGWPWQGYRLVRCTKVERGGVLIPTVTYWFEETGEHVPSLREPAVEDPSPSRWPWKRRKS